MGDWSIVVQGTGAHHNQDFPSDADRMAQRFVDGLVKAGHDVKVALFTAGGLTVLDTLDNVQEHRLATYAPDFHDGVRQTAAARLLAAEALGLAPSKRREPLRDED